MAACPPGDASGLRDSARIEDADRAEQRIARAAELRPEVQRVAEGEQPIDVDDLPWQDGGDPRRIRHDRLRRDSAAGILDRHHHPTSEDRLAGCAAEACRLPRDARRRRGFTVRTRGRRPGRDGLGASGTHRGLGRSLRHPCGLLRPRRTDPRRAHPRERVDERSAGEQRRLPQSEQGNHDALLSDLKFDAGARAQRGRDLVARAARAAHIDREPQRIQRREAGPSDVPFVDDVESRDRADRLPQLGEFPGRHREQRFTLGLRACPRRVERREQQAARAGARDDAERPPDPIGRQPVRRVRRQMQHRRAVEAAEMLVRARHDEVGATGERIVGQRRTEAQVRTPRLVDDQRGIVPTADLREPGDVGADPEVRGRDDEHRADVRCGAELGVERGRLDAVGDAERAVELGHHGDRVEASDGDAVEDARV